MADDPKPAAAPSIADKVDQWFIENFQSGPVAQNTPAYNQVYLAKDKLKALLAK